MARSKSQQKAQAAWKRKEALGGHGVWESDMVVVSLSKTDVTNEDLSLFRDFPYVQILNLGNTDISDDGLVHLEGLKALEELIVKDTKISAAALEAFRRAHPAVKVTTSPASKGAINPFTGKPFK